MTVAESTPADGMTALAEAAVLSGKTHLVGVGGDGTHHDIINGIMRAGGLTKVTYAPLPIGTGNDWVRTLETPRRINPWLEMLHRQKTIDHRVGKLEYAAKPDSLQTASNLQVSTNPAISSPLVSRFPVDEHEERVITYFLNVAGLAYDAEVVRRSEKARWKNRWLYPLLTLLYLKDFTPPTVKIEYEGKTITSAVHTINIGIGRYSGGGMRLVPQADPRADTLALTFARRLPVWKILLSSWRFYTGSIGALSEVTTTHARLISILPVAGRTDLEADGELLGGVPLTASIVNEHLKVVVKTPS